MSHFPSSHRLIHRAIQQVIHRLTKHNPFTSGFSNADAEDAGTFMRAKERRMQGLEDNPPDAKCSFCNRPREEAGPMVEGPGGLFMCAQCIGLASGIVDEM